MILDEVLSEHHLCGFLEEVDELEVADLFEGVVCGRVG